jgi:hypothetical protein
MFFDAHPGTPDPAVPSHISATLRNFAPDSQILAKKLILAYGLPEEATATRLFWRGPAPFLYTILHAEGSLHNFPVPHEDIVEQAVSYPVGSAIGRLDEMAAYNGSVSGERTAGRLVSRAETPQMNLLALNLAHEVLAGKKTWKEARQYLAQAHQAFEDGKNPLYTMRLIFTPARTPDPDVSIATAPPFVG